MYRSFWFLVICLAWLSAVWVDFEDSLNMTPRQAYNPSLQPDRTILKPSPDTSRFDTPTAMKQKSLRKRPHAADFFWRNFLHVALLRNLWHFYCIFCYCELLCLVWCHDKLLLKYKSQFTYYVTVWQCVKYLFLWTTTGI